jgi:hypothetical protein
MNLVVSATPKSDMIISIRFSDGFEGELNVKPFITTGISQKLSDPEIFKKVQVDDFGGISWPNGFDFCPNFLRQYLQSRV